MHKEIPIASFIKIAIATSVTLVLWTMVVVAGALFGWWRQPLAQKDDSASFALAAIRMIDEGNRGNAALVLIENGAISTEYFSSRAGSVDRDTVFATASMSKWITALGVMKLVEDGKLDLDRPVEDYLTRWHLPSSEFDNRGVTVRRLLSHTAGLTDGLGFGDYRPDEPLPTLEQSLTNPRASSGEPVVIAVGIKPGSEWRYSGGGYLLLELLVEEVSGESFEAYMSRVVLQPLDMTRSGYNATDMEKSSKYESRAATGFNSSAGDMAKVVLAQIQAIGDRPLAQQTIDSMRKPHAKVFGVVDVWGLGTMLYAPTSSGDFIFGHDGSNEPAINVAVRINPDNGDALVILETGNKTLASQLGSEWVFWQTGTPDFLDVPKEFRSVLPVLIGGAFVILLAAIRSVWRLNRVRRRAGQPSQQSGNGS